MKDVFRELDITALIESGHNPRRHFRLEKLQELAESIREKGIIEPIVVRPLGEDTFEIVAGARRVRAAGMAGVTQIPSIVRNLTDLQVLETMAVENGQREDIHPLEEAEGYQALMAADPIYTPELLAARVGKSVSSVRDRLKLLQLIPEVRDAFLEDTITAAHAIRIARLAQADQPEALKACFTPLYRPADGVDRMALEPVHELDEWIRRHTKIDLQSAETAELFPKLAERLEQAAAKGEALREVSSSYVLARDVPAGVLAKGKYRVVEGKSDCPHTETAVIVHADADRELGKVLKICAHRKCMTHFPPAETREQRPAYDYQAEQEKREAERKAWQALRPQAVAAVVAKVKAPTLNDALVRDLIADLFDTLVKEIEEVLGAKVSVKTFTKAVALGKVVREAWSRDRFKPVAKQYGVDLGKLEKSIRTEATAAVSESRKTKIAKRAKKTARRRAA